MSILDFSNLGPKPSGSKNSLKLVLGIGTLVATIALGSTLAANINLNAGAQVEFGQGVAQTTACDDEVTITPYSTFVNNYENPDFRFTSFSVTGISDSCYGKVFIIKAYSNSDNSSLDLYAPDGGEPFSEVQVLDTAGSFSLVNSGLNSDYIEDVSTGFKVTMVTIGLEAGAVLASAQDVDRITIESRDPDFFVASYSVGDVGPSGGFVYYVDEDGFNCGPQHNATGSPENGICHYLEVAPSGWNGGGEPSKSWALQPNWSSDVSGIPNGGDLYNDPLGIGLGFKNSIAIVDQGNNSETAAGLARSYRGGTMNDWYLPTAAELNLLCQWVRGVSISVTTSCTGGATNSSVHGASSAGFMADVYWSSSELQYNTAFDRDFENAAERQNYKGDAYYVRPVRAF
jgi:hypothetical protein